MNTITAVLAQAARNFPDRPFLTGKTVEGWSSIGFADVRDRARSFSGWLLQHGIKKGDRVALFAEGRPEWVVFELGVLLAGAISVPLSINLSEEEIVVPINHSEASIVAVTRETVNKICSVMGEIKYPLTLVFMDDDSEYLMQALKNAGLSKNRGIRFTDCMTLGRRHPPGDELDRIEDCVAEDDVVTISYTSGTSDSPKGVMLTHRNCVSNCLQAAEVFAVPDIKYTTLLLLPCNHSFTHTAGIFLALFRGITLFFPPIGEGVREGTDSVFSVLHETNPVFLLTLPSLSGFFMNKILHDVEAEGGLRKVLFDFGIRAGVRYHGDGFNRPALWERLKSFFPYRLAEGLIFFRIRKIFGNKFRYFVGGGALLDRKQQEFFMALGIPVFQGYGLTEASPVISANTPKVHKLGTSGKVFPGVTCKILKNDGHPAGIDEIGEICIQGRNVMKGYYKNDEATGTALRDGWLHTGDLGYIDDDGFLVVVGREASILVTAGGERFSPEEIEEAILNTSPVVRQVMLFNDRRKYTSALVVASHKELLNIKKKSETGEAGEILKILKESVFAFKKEPYYARRFPVLRLPTTFRIIDGLFTEKNRMVNSTLKMVRHRIKEAYKDEIEYLYTDAGRDPINDANLETIKKLLR